jgi:hypothetical protein
MRNAVTLGVSQNRLDTIRRNLELFHDLGDRHAIVEPIIMGEVPTILLVKGWRVFFYSNEGNEPMHVHARKGDAECKFWIDADRFEAEEAFEHGLTPQLRREIRQVIFEHFDEICVAWKAIGRAQ